MDESPSKIKKSISDFCLKNEGLLVKQTTDSAGNDCVEWQTSLILEVVAGVQEKKERSISRQTVPAQFDVSFDEKQRVIRVFLQWGKIEPSLFRSAETEVMSEMRKDGTVKVRYHGDRQAVEVCALYPFHEFDFSVVYREVVGHFGLINAIFFKSANQGEEA